MSALRQLRDLRHNHRALACVEVPTLEVERDDERKRIGDASFSGARLDALHQAGAVSISSVENLAFVKPNRLALAVPQHILAELVEFLVRHHRKQIGQWVKLELVHSLVTPRCEPCDPWPW